MEVMFKKVTPALHLVSLAQYCMLHMVLAGPMLMSNYIKQCDNIKDSQGIDNTVRCV